MADLIDNQCAVELAMCYCSDDDGSCSKADADIRELLDEIENLPVVDSANLWIPCDKRMPEKNTEVLAYSPSWGRIVVAIWTGEYWLEQWKDDDFDESEFSHWLPLPDMPITL